jgi:hypothetical protein
MQSIIFRSSSSTLTYLHFPGRCLLWSITTRWKERAWIWSSTSTAISKAQHFFLMYVMYIQPSWAWHLQKWLHINF